jgi:2-polyprenyl-3-methyl-5-hydroxy-6-metoxy-1,4-benzoquinol methylase
MADIVHCWCGETLEERLNEHYWLCLSCGTAVLSHRPDASHFAVTDDERDFYGRRYWHEYQAEREFPEIEERVRADLSDRCLFWLANILEFVTPPGRILEIGCGHGGFVALLSELGFQAEGTELSPWVTEFARRAFGIRVHCGLLESLNLSPGMAGVCSFDVLEHVADPQQFLRQARDLLDGDGVLFLQTPWYRGEGPSWSMFQPGEHVFLFSEKAARLLLERSGFRDIVIRPSLYPHDMWVVAARRALPTGREPFTRDRMPAAFRALMDLRAEQAKTSGVVRQLEADRAARLDQVHELTRGLHESESDRRARLGQIFDLTRALHESEADREARLKQIHDLTERQQELEGDGAARLGHIHELTRLLQQSEADRALRLEHIHELTRSLQQSEADRALRLEQIHDLTRRVQEGDAASEARMGQIHELTRLLLESETARTTEGTERAELERRVRELQEVLLTTQHELTALTGTWTWRVRERLRAWLFPDRRGR